MSTTTVLKRKQIGATESGEQDKKRKPTPPLSEFEQVCYEIVGDLPFTEASVKAYKKQKIHEERAKVAIWKPLRYAWAVRLLEYSLIVVASALAALFPVSVFVLVVAIFAPPTEYLPSILALSAFAFGLISVIFIATACAITHLHKVRVPYWQIVSPERYKSPWFRTVPDEVCRFIPLFLERLPGCSCLIEHLTYTGDPFFVIRWKGQRHYVFVWNEADFAPA